jgi:hypothetical protein
MPSLRKRSSSSSPQRERRGEAAGRALVAAWQASGLSQAAFSRRSGVSEQRLSYWRLRLPRMTKPSGFVEIPAPAATVAKAGVIPAQGGEVVVEFGRELRVRVGRGFDPVLLRAVVSTLMDPVRPC